MASCNEPHIGAIVPIFGFMNTIIEDLSTIFYIIYLIIFRFMRQGGFNCNAKPGYETTCKQ
jgi:hypothetical protein